VKTCSLSLQFFLYKAFIKKRHWTTTDVKAEKFGIAFFEMLFY
jgi:hypothetical protein